MPESARETSAGAPAPGPGPAPGRQCGPCSLCCTVLRVDPLRKLGGTPCVHQRAAQEPGATRGGCRIHASRPRLCRAYRCLWLQGSLDEEDRPDRLGAVVDLVAHGPALRLEIREARPGAFDASPRLQAIAARYRRSVPVRISDVADPLDPDRPYRVLLPDGSEQHVRGARTTVWRGGRAVEERRLGALERAARRVVLWIQARRLRRYRGAARPEPDSSRLA